MVSLLCVNLKILLNICPLTLSQQLVTVLLTQKLEIAENHPSGSCLSYVVRETDDP